MPTLPPFEELQDPAAMYALLVSMYEALKELEELRAENARLREENERYKRMLFGPGSERIEPVERILKKKDKRTSEQKKQQAQQKRRKREEKKKALEEQVVVHEVKEEQLECPSCGGKRFTDLGDGEQSLSYEYVPGRIVKRRHIRKKKACVCGGYIATAPGPERVVENCQYGPGLHAHVVVSKCLNGMPLYRQGKQFGRDGLSIPKSSLGDLFHRSAALLKPLWQRMLELLAEEDLVNADETRLKVQQKKKMRTAWVWTFVTQTIVAYVFSPSRSGKTPEQVLQGSSGILQVDGYTGYNIVCTPENRERAGCLAHVRRYFYQARSTFEEAADKVLDWVLQLYQVEYQAAEEKILGTEKHLAMRQVKSQKVMEKFGKWLRENEHTFPPKSAMASAIAYTVNNWDSLQVFLTNAKVPLDNNISERALRPIAVGRKNFLCVGSDEAGESLAILQSLCASCEANGVNPQTYLTDVLIRIQTHPNSRIDELLPHLWKPQEKNPDATPQEAAASI